MWRHAVFLSILVAAALALSVVLIPGRQELALMHYKAGNYSDALQGFEQVVVRGSARTTVVMPLNDLYLRRADTDQAVAAIARTLAERPRDIEAYDLALDVYRGTMETQRYLETLARRIELVPSTAMVRELAGLYALRGDHTAEIEALSNLVISDAATDDEILRLARLYTAHDELARAVTLLDNWITRPASQLSRNAAAFAFEVYLEAEREKSAVGVLLTFVQRQPQAESYLHAIALLSKHDLLDGTAAELARELERTPPQITLAVPAFALATRAPDMRAFVDYVARLDEQASLRDLRTGGATARKLSQASRAMLRRLLSTGNAQQLDSSSQLALLQAVAKVAHTELASVVGEVLPAPPATLASAEFRLLAGDDVGCAAIVDGINASALGSSHERLRYANLLLGLGHDARAADILSAQQRWDSRDLADLAWMYYDLGQGQYAYPIFGSDLVAAGDANSMQAWAILAASGGDVGPVQEWLGEINVAQQLWLRNDTLFELAMVGLQHDSDELLQRVADNVATHTASAASSSEQARLLLLAGRFHEAAALSAMGMRQYRPVRQTLKLSLLTLWQLAADEGRTSATLEAGLVALAEATAAVADSTNDIQEMTVLAHDLLAIGAQRVAFPVLSQLFSVAPQDWYELFRESAVASGRTAYFLQQLGQRLATIEPEDARYDAYLHDLARLGGHAEALPYLSIIVARSDLQTERRRAALYAARDVANALSQQAWFAEQLGTWLETHGLDDPLADIWLYELSEAGEYERAIPHLRRLLTAVRGDHARSATVFYELQTALLATGEGATLVNVIAEELRSPAITTRQQQTYVEILFASSAKQAALPVLEAHANRDPQQWGQAFLHWLAERGDERTGLSFMRRHAADTALSDSLRRDFGERLLAAGLKREALAVFTELARNERPGSAAIEQLLWLWGPRPGHAAIDWLAMRAEFAEGRARAAWADILTRLGASRRAVASLANAAEASDADPVLLQSYVAALLASGDKVAAKTYLSSLVARVPSNAMLRWIAQLAGEHEFTILGHAAWRATLDAQPRDVRALKALGMHAFDRGQRSDAEKYFQRYMNVDADDYEVQFFYAELLAERGAGDRAVAHYRRARLLLDQLEVIDFRQRVIDAQVLHRLGHLPASVAAYEALLRERPQAQHLRADYVSMLLDSSALQRAKQVLAAQRPAP